MIDEKSSERAIRIMALIETVRPILAGEQPEVQAAVIAHMTGIYLLGWRGANRKAARMEMLLIMNELALEFAAIEEKESGH